MQGRQENAQNADRENGTVLRDPPPMCGREDRLVGRSGRVFHHVRFRLAHAEREGGKDVGHQIEEEDLEREEGKRKRGQRRDADHHDFAHVAREQVADEGADVGKDCPALLDGDRDGGECVVLKHDVGRFAGHLRPSLPHRHADVRAFEGRRIVDAVSGHGDDVSLCLEEVDELQLLLRRDAGEDGRGDLATSLVEFVLKVPAVDCGRVRPVGWVSGQDADGPGDVRRGGRLVARHHDHLDPGALAGGDRRRYVRTGRVHETNQPDEIKSRVGVVGAGVWFQLRGESEDTEPVGGHCLVLRQPRLAPARVLLVRVGGCVCRTDQGSQGITPRYGLRGAGGQDRFGRALNEDERLAIRRVIGRAEAGHHLCRAVERDEPGCGEPVAEHRRVGAQGGSELEESPFHRVSDHLVGIVGVKSCRGAQRRDPGGELEERVRLILAVDPSGLCNGRVLVRPAGRQAGAPSLDVDAGLLVPEDWTGAGEDEALDRHPVFGERSGFVGADDRGRAQGLDGREAADEGIPAGHASQSAGEGNRGHDRQPFGNRGDGERDAHLDHHHQVPPAGDAEPRNHDHETEDDHHEAFREVRQPLFEGGAPVVGRRRELGNLAQLGLHAGRRDHAFPGSARDRRALVCHARTFGKRSIGRHRCLLFVDRHRFAGEGRFVDPKPRDLAEAQVGTDHVSLVQKNDIPGNQLSCGDGLHVASTSDRGVDAVELPEGLHRADRPPFHAETDDCVQEEDDADGARFDDVPKQKRYEGGRDQQQHDEASHLVDQDPPDRDRIDGPKRIRTACGETAHSLRGRQPVGGRPEPAERGVRRLCPGVFGGCARCGRGIRGRPGRLSVRRGGRGGVWRGGWGHTCFRRWASL